jgi:hypothetical protein
MLAGQARLPAYRIPGVASRRLRSRYATYLVQGNPAPQDARLIREAICATRGRALDQAASKASKRYPKVPESAVSERVRRAASEIRANGYFVTSFGGFAGVDQLAFHDAAVKVLEASKEVGAMGLEQVLSGTVPSSIEMWSLSEDWVLGQPLTQRVLTDPYILEVASQYLGVSPVLSQTSSWFSLNSPRSQEIESAQQWHWDCDRVKWLKVFVYITDVDGEHGPHEFVRGTHRRLPRTSLSSRVPDSRVRHLYADEDIISMVGPPGTLVFEDTRGLHRGRPVQRGHRLVLQLEFSIDLFGAAAPLLPAVAQDYLTEPTFAGAWPRLALRGFNG